VQIITDAMRDLNTVSLLDEETRAAVLAAFEHAMHSSFGELSHVSDCETDLR
jgi:hypothetical protein